MTAGQWDRTVLQALARDGLEGVFEKLRQEFDFLVIDSHPVLSATDSLLLAQRVDGVILSVLRTVSLMPQVYAASQRLAGLGVRVLGAVVNASDPNEVYTSPASTATQVAA
jgi:Mrp family chromosome partitioning ATPase